MLTKICTQPLAQRSGPAPSHGPLWPNPLVSAAHIPEPIPSMYTRHAAWTKDVTVEMVSCLFKAASSPIVFMKLTQDRISLILTTHLRPNSWWVSQSMKSSITSAMSAPKTRKHRGLLFTTTPERGFATWGPQTVFFKEHEVHSFNRISIGFNEQHSTPTPKQTKNQKENLRIKVFKKVP